MRKCPRISLNAKAAFLVRISKDFLPACLPWFKPSTAIYLNERVGIGFSKKKIGRFVEITGCSIQFMIQNAQGIDKWKTKY